MFCKKCGSSLPSQGYICKVCGTMMDSEQIKIQKEFIKERKKENNEVSFRSDFYSKIPISRDYKKIKENKYLGALLIVLILLILVIVAILKVM